MYSMISKYGSIQAASWVVLAAVLELICIGSTACGQQPLHLKRSIDSIPEVSSPLSTRTAHFRVMFGAGDSRPGVPQRLTRYGELTVDPQGASRAGSYAGEERVYYVLEGTGTLGYGGREVPISEDDFFYIPPGVDHRFINGREAPLRAIVMGFKAGGPSDGAVSELQIANTADVTPEVLGGHGPTVRYQLMLGGTDSKRDRIAAGRQITSLYIMDFNPGGSNGAHTHENAIEIYYVLRGHGEMLAGEPDGTSKRYPAKAGDAFLFTQDSPVGFFNGAPKGEPNTRILAIRTIIPDQ